MTIKKVNARLLRFAQNDRLGGRQTLVNEIPEGVGMSAIAGLNQDAAELQQRIERFQTVRDGILTQVRQVIVGQDDVLDQILIALFVGGHCLITGMPGTAKTLMVRTIAQTLGLSFKRIQFTPDLMPSDITGTDIIEEDITTGHRKWTFVEGPIFGNVVLADEINRTPPKTQAAMLEAMQERSCTVRGHIYKLPAPFFVLATQNPIELEGTYPLPEAQLDRFLFNAVLDYLSAEDEVKVVDLTTATKDPQVTAVTNAAELLEFQRLVRMVPIGESLAKYVVNLVRATRHKSENAPDFVKKYVNYGGSIRAAQFIVLAAKARALSRRRYHVTYEDITALAIPVLRHRILLNFHAESERIDSDEVLTRLIAHLPPPKEG
jgi:MoxR-like ATPase